MYGKADGDAGLARRLYQERCPNRWIGRGGPIAWRPRSPDLNPIDFYLWGHLKSLLYSSPVPDMESLRNRIVAGCEEIRNTPGIWDRVRRAMRHRCEACIQSGGGHFSRDFVGKLLIFADNFNWDDLPPKDPNTGKPSIALMIPRIKKASLGVLIAAFGFLFAQTAISVIISEERPLIFNTWYPYDISKSPAYEITMAFQTMGLIFGCGFVLYVFPPFYATLVVIACCQFEKLRAMLSDMKQQSTSSVFSTEDGDEEFKMQKELFIHMRRQLHNCIRLHQQVLRYKNELEETFSILFVGIFLLLLVALCFTTYSAALVTQWLGARLLFRHRWSKASCLGLALRNSRWFESSWGNHEISAIVWDRCSPNIVMHLGNCGRYRNRLRKPAIRPGGYHRANHTTPLFWLDDRPPLLRYVDVTPAAGWSVRVLHGRSCLGLGLLFYGLSEFSSDMDNNKLSDVCRF
ncbi:hypothetical protein ANN_17279 [Periplaneta americana]|uniref:Odorant receptor n=1 Tax=Periplaneta americana TaxID=6978 RepID=A0ABQ8SSH3_PERAM|nr:hypothetical protein ANN_17279 [Periplaneta americana]